MLKMDGAQLTPAGYRLFERLFIFINEKNSKIKRYEDKIAQPATTATESSQQNTAIVQEIIEVKYLAVDSDLLGVNNLWDAALGCPDPIVVDAALEFLNGLHQNVRYLVCMKYLFGF